MIDPGYLEWAGVAAVKHAYRVFRERGFRSRVLVAAFRNALQWSEFQGGDLVVSPPFQWSKDINDNAWPFRPDAIDDEVPAHVLDALRAATPEFARGYDVDGMTIDEFDRFGATVTTLRQFLTPTRSSTPGPRHHRPGGLTAMDTLGVGLVSVGWMGRLHSRAYRALPDHFPELGARPRLVVAADPVPEARDQAVGSPRVRARGRRLPRGPRRPRGRRRLDLLAELPAPGDGGGGCCRRQAVLDREADGSVRQRLPCDPRSGRASGTRHERRFQLPARSGDPARPRARPERSARSHHERARIAPRRLLVRPGTPRSPGASSVSGRGRVSSVTCCPTAWTSRSTWWAGSPA